MCIDHFEVKKETLFEKYQNIYLLSLFSYKSLVSYTIPGLLDFIRIPGLWSQEKNSSGFFCIFKNWNSSRPVDQIQGLPGL